MNDKEKVIEATGLTKRYGRARGIEDVDLVVRRGEIFGFIGPNGAGKSTFVRVLLGLIRATDGQARILGMPCEPSAKPLLARVGYLPSEIQFYHGMRVGELVKFSARLRHRDCSAEAARLADRLGLDMKRKIDDLSLGNRKKVGVVCALQHEPELLILDEPTSGLDPLVQQEFFALLEERRAAGGTVMLSSHVLSEVQRYCDRAAVIREGRIIAEGSVEELASTSARRVRVVAAAPVEAPVLEGVRSFEPRADGASFLFQGDMGALVAWLATLPVLDVTIEEPDLDEVFMHFYTGEEDAGTGGEAGRCGRAAGEREGGSMTVFLHEMRQNAKMLAVWSVVIGGMVVLCVAMFPDISAQSGRLHGHVCQLGGVHRGVRHGPAEHRGAPGVSSASSAAPCWASAARSSRRTWACACCPRRNRSIRRNVCSPIRSAVRVWSPRSWRPWWCASCC